jgi:hypothetical protein
LLTMMKEIRTKSILLAIHIGDQTTPTPTKNQNTSCAIPQ